MLLQTWSSPLPPLSASRRYGCRKASQRLRSHRRRVIISNKLPNAEFADILQNKVLLAATISGAIGQLSKPFTSSLFSRSGGLDFRKALQAGGFPSSHSSAAVAVATTLGFERGFSDPIYGLAVVYACLTMYDAQGVRREVGNHARCLNKVLNEEKLKQIVSINGDNDSQDSISRNSSTFVEKSASFESAQEIGSLLVEPAADSRTSVNRESKLSSDDYSPLKESVDYSPLKESGEEKPRIHFRWPALRRSPAFPGFEDVAALGPLVSVGGKRGYTFGRPRSPHVDKSWGETGEEKPRIHFRWPHRN